MNTKALCNASRAAPSGMRSCRFINDEPFQIHLLRNAWASLVAVRGRRLPVRSVSPNWIDFQIMESSEPTEKQWAYVNALCKRKAYYLEEVQLKIHLTVSGDPTDRHPIPKPTNKLTRFDLAKLIDWLTDQPDQEEGSFIDTANDYD